MTDGLADKKGHSLYQSSDPADFLARFERDGGLSARRLVETFVEPEAVVTTVVAGSIPLGIGTAASDVDLLVLTRTADALRTEQPEAEALGELLYSTPVARTGVGSRSNGSTGEGPLSTAQVIALVNGIEVDLQTLSLPRLEAMVDELEAGRISLSEKDTALLSRLKSGWILDLAGSCATLDRLRDDQALEVHWATRYFVFSLQALEDARAALDDNLPLALHLQRRSVEMAFLAYFASCGYAFVGSKWPRFLAHHCRGAQNDEGIELWSSEGLRLLFPTLSFERSEVAASLEANAQWLRQTRRRIDRDMACRIAFEISPQIGPLEAE